MIPGALNCDNCSRRFRFENPRGAKDVLADLKRGGTASPAILREVRCYILNKENYPFKGERQ